MTSHNSQPCRYKVFLKYEIAYALLSSIYRQTFCCKLCIKFFFRLVLILAPCLLLQGFIKQQSFYIGSNFPIIVLIVISHEFCHDLLNAALTWSLIHKFSIYMDDNQTTILEEKYYMWSDVIQKIWMLSKYSLTIFNWTMRIALGKLLRIYY